jgi:hypothetical protein
MKFRAFEFLGNNDLMDSNTPSSTKCKMCPQGTETAPNCAECPNLNRFLDALDPQAKRVLLCHLSSASDDATVNAMLKTALPRFTAEQIENTIIPAVALHTAMMAKQRG